MDMTTDELQRKLVLLASHNHFISYDKLASTLSIDNERQLENFLIHVISNEIIKGRLNPRERRLEVSDWSSQKIGDEMDLETMEQTLDHWIIHCESVIKSLHEETEKSNQNICMELAREKKIEEESEKIRKLINLSGGKLGRDTENSGQPRSSGQKNDAKRYKGAGAMRLRRN